MEKLKQQKYEVSPISQGGRCSGRGGPSCPRPSSQRLPLSRADQRAVQPHQPRPEVVSVPSLTLGLVSPSLSPLTLCDSVPRPSTPCNAQDSPRPKGRQAENPAPLLFLALPVLLAVHPSLSPTFHLFHPSRGLSSILPTLLTHHSLPPSASVLPNTHQHPREHPELLPSHQVPQVGGSGPQTITTPRRERRSRLPAPFSGQGEGELGGADFLS